MNPLRTAITDLLHGRPLERLAWTIHVILTVVLLGLLIDHNWGRVGPGLLPLWIHWMWVAFYASMALAPLWPALGLVEYAFLATVIARYEPGVNVGYNNHVMMQLAVLTTSAAAVWAVRKGRHFHLPRARNIAAWLMIALASWVGFTYLYWGVTAGRWSPAEEHHPSIFALNLLVFLLATQLLGDRLSTGLVCLAATSGLAIRGLVAFAYNPGGVYLQEDIATLVAMTMPLIVLGPVCAKSWMSRFFLAVVFVAIAMVNSKILLGTANRSGAVALGAGMLMLCLWTPGVLRWLSLGGAGIAACVLAMKLRDSQYAQRFMDLWSGGKSMGSAESRVRLWKVAGQMFESNPWLGVGPGQFEKLVPVYAPKVPANSPHNNFIAMAVETGLPGLALYTLLFLSVIFVAVRTIRLMRSDWPSPAARVLPACVTAYLTAGLFITRHDLSFAYLLAGWIVGLYHHVAGPDILRERLIENQSGMGREKEKESGAEAPGLETQVRE